MGKELENKGDVVRIQEKLGEKLKLENVCAIAVSSRRTITAGCKSHEKP